MSSVWLSYQGKALSSSVLESFNSVTSSLTSVSISVTFVDPKCDFSQPMTVDSVNELYAVKEPDSGDDR